MHGLMREGRREPALYSTQYSIPANAGSSALEACNPVTQSRAWEVETRVWSTAVWDFLVLMAKIQLAKYGW